jgi:hypothetical protein
MDNKYGYPPWDLTSPESSFQTPKTSLFKLATKMPFDITKSRERFPALQQDQVFLDNAGGSQALGDVIDS